MMSKKLIWAVGQSVFASEKMEEVTQVPEKSTFQKFVDAVRPDRFIDWYHTTGVAKRLGMTEAKRLRSAAKRGRTDVVKGILSKDTGISLDDKQEALKLAQESGHTETAKELEKVKEKPQDESEKKLGGSVSQQEAFEQGQLAQQVTAQVKPSFEQAGVPQGSKQEHVVPQNEIAKGESKFLLKFGADQTDVGNDGLTQTQRNYVERQSQNRGDKHAGAWKERFKEQNKLGNVIKIHVHKEGYQVALDHDKAQDLLEKRLFKNDVKLEVDRMGSFVAYHNNMPLPYHGRVTAHPIFGAQGDLDEFEEAKTYPYRYEGKIRSHGLTDEQNNEANSNPDQANTLRQQYRQKNLKDIDEKIESLLKLNLLSIEPESFTDKQTKIENMERLAKLYQDKAIILDKSNSTEAAKNYEEAIKYYKKILEYRTADHRAYRDLSDVYKKLGTTYESIPSKREKSKEALSQSDEYLQKANNIKNVSVG